MDQGTLVAEQIAAGEQLVKNLREHGFAVRIAYRAFTEESGQWTLYLVTDETERGAEAYRIVHQEARRLNSLWIEPFDVTLLRPTDRPARVIEAYLKTYPARLATRVRGQLIGDVYFENAFIYPPEPASPPAVRAP
jgi:hypothetical protein